MKKPSSPSASASLNILSYPATLTVEEVYRDRDQFASLVREVAGMDVGRMGIEILSFTIKVRCVYSYSFVLPPNTGQSVGRA